MSKVSKDYGRLWKTVIGTTDPDKVVRILRQILLDKEGRAYIAGLADSDAVLCIELLDNTLAGHKLRSIDKQAFFVALRRLAGTHGILPETVMITEDIEVEDQILASGGFSDVRLGTYQGHLVAVKSLRVAVMDDLPKIKKQFCKEVILWSSLSHPNVLKLFGVQGDLEKGQFVTVSEWMSHGNIMQYIKKHAVNRLELLHGAAEGLKYLHNARLTHGDLKGANILMSNDTPPRACLADFGFMTMVLNPKNPMSCSAQLEGGTTTFMSPELLVPSRFGFRDAVPTPEADIYAFGLVIFQVLTGVLPYREMRQTELAFAVVMDGLRPSRPENASATGFSDTLWDFVQLCWQSDMRSRPGVADLVAHLGEATSDWNDVMEPSIEAETIASAFPEPTSDSSIHNIYRSSSVLTKESSPTESSTSSPVFSGSGSTSTLCTELSQETPQAVVVKPPHIPQFAHLPPLQKPLPTPPQVNPTPLQPIPTSRLPNRPPRISTPTPRTPTSLMSRQSTPTPRPPPSDDPHDDSQDVSFPHLDQDYKPPPSRLVPKERRGLRAFLKSKILEFFGPSKRSRK